MAAGESRSLNACAKWRLLSVDQHSKQRRFAAVAATDSCYTALHSCL